ncbi:DNA cytosine methyltransferase [Marinobacter sp. 1Y8]
MYKLVDLFCGCGGISRGFEWSGRFGSQLGVEIEKHPINTFRSNIKNIDGGEPVLFNGDITELAENPKYLWRLLSQGNIYNKGDIDVLAGGPPCQGFSRNGVRKYEDGESSIRFYDDPRNHLYKEFLKIIEETCPKLILIENVREFLNFGEGKFSRDLINRLEELGYAVNFKKVCAANYGVPQKRYRVIFIAANAKFIKNAEDVLSFPEETHSDTDDGQLQLDFTKPFVTVKDAFEALPQPVWKHGVPVTISKNPRTDFGRIVNRGVKLVENHVARELSEKNIQRIRAVGHGRMKDICGTLKTKKFYGSAYGRLSWDAPALTITTWVYHVGSGRFAHPSEDRAITMREAARLQSFDDGFVFPPLINPTSQMIGNAVPPLLALKFAEIFAEILDKNA